VEFAAKLLGCAFPHEDDDELFQKTPSPAMDEGQQE
jgi:hypothetical protein